MTRFHITACLASVFFVSLLSVSVAAQTQEMSEEKLRSEGLFGFPADESRTHCDTEELRLQSWNDQDSLIVQAIIWKDNDDALGETDDGRPIGDSSNLLFDFNLDKKQTAKSDRGYMLDPWPSIPGLRYSIPYGGGASSHIKADSTGRGSIRYVQLGKDRKVRVDTFVIPFDEVDTESGKEIGIAFLASSTSPRQIVNSIGFVSKRERYYAHSLPVEDFATVKLKASDTKVDLEKIPAGREDQEEPQKATPMPKFGSVPPELSATDWINIDSAPTLETLKGKVVLVEFWATWCGPCIKGIPHLNELHESHADDLVVLSFTDQSKKGIENFLKKTEMKYPLGVGSELSKAYGVTGLPHAFLIGRDGKVVWHGNPVDGEAMDKEIEKAIEKRED